VPDLSVEIGALRLKNPIVCGSSERTMTIEDLCAAVDAGAAAVVVKSTNESAAARRQLEVAEYALLDPDWAEVEAASAGRSSTLFNRSGLSSLPFEEWLQVVVVADAYACTHDAYAVASLIPAGVDELVRMAAAIEAAGVRWLEVNLGAAHGEEAAPGAIELVAETERVTEIVGRVRATVALPLTVKLPGHGDVIELAAAAQAAGADSVCLAGRTLGFLPDLETRRPVLGTFGAIGGAWALPLTLRWVAKARQRLGTEFPFLATNGIRDGRDAARALLAGASAVELATAVWIDGFDTLTHAIGQLAAYLEEQGLDAADIVGESADAVMSYEEVQAVRRAT
jgi:dihydroorotate dehydrogenase (NAD+) catalytic subunit